MSTTPNTAAGIESLVNQGVLRESHPSQTRGYVSRKSTGYVSEYSGKFGVGYKLLTPSFESTRYCFVTYYISA